MTRDGKDVSDIAAKLRELSVSTAATKRTKGQSALPSGSSGSVVKAPEVDEPGWSMIQGDDTMENFMVNYHKYAEGTGMDMPTEEAEEVYAAVDRKRQQLGTPEVPPQDRIFYGKFADIDLSKVVYNSDAHNVETRSLRRQNHFSAATALATILEETQKNDPVNRNTEMMYARMLEPLTQCKQPSNCNNLEACMYYACSICAVIKLTGELMQLVRDQQQNVLPTWIRDTKDLIDGNLEERRISKGMTFFRCCKECFERTQCFGKTLSKSMFHKYMCAAEASWAHMMTGQCNIGAPQYRDVAYSYVMEHKKDMRDVTNLLQLTDGSQSPNLIEAVLEDNKKREEKRKEERAAEAPEAKKRKSKSNESSVPVVARLIKLCVEHPDLKCGLPGLTEMIEKLRQCRQQNQLNLFNLAITSTDYMTVLISAPGKHGAPGRGPKVLLKYMQASAGHYTDARSGREVFCPMGYCPEHEALWTPCKAGGKNYWIDPAFGQALDREAPYLLMFCSGDAEEEETIEVFRAENPSSSIGDFLAILKAHANGVFDIKDAHTLRELWDAILKGLKHTQEIEAQVWRNLPNCKFGFRIRNIFEMEEWSRKTSLELSSVDKHLGITDSMLRSRHQAIGYNLAQIEGYDHQRIIRQHGWALIKHHLMGMLNISDYQQLHGALARSGKQLSKNRMKMLRNASQGYQF